MNLHFYTYKTFPFYRSFKIPLGTYSKGKKIDIHLKDVHSGFVCNSQKLDAYNKTETDSQR